MNPQIFESLGWLLLMLQLPILVTLLRFVDNEKIIIILIFIINLTTTFFYYYAYDSLVLSLIIGFSLSAIFSICFSIQESEIVDIDPYYSIIIWAFILLLIGIYTQSYIFIISSFIWLSFCTILLIDTFFLQTDENKRNLLRFRSEYLFWIIAIFPILFIMNLFGISNIFNIIDATSIYWLYSTIAQVFAALLGIIIMIGVFKLNTLENNTSIFKNRLTKALKGHTILFTVVIFLSIFGITFLNKDSFELSNTTSQIDLSLALLIQPINEKHLPDINQIFNSVIFITILSFVIGSFIYLYEIVRIVLDHEIE